MHEKKYLLAFLAYHEYLFTSLSLSKYDIHDKTHAIKNLLTIQTENISKKEMIAENKSEIVDEIKSITSKMQANIKTSRSYFETKKLLNIILQDIFASPK